MSGIIDRSNMAGKRDKVSDDKRFSIIVQDLTKCFLCGSTANVELHECFHGVSNRAKSKQYGLIVPLCKQHHTGDLGPHSNSVIDRKLKNVAEKFWVMTYTDEYTSAADKIEAFIDIFRDNVLDESDIE